jgi:hypothetical protein
MPCCFFPSAAALGITNFVNVAGVRFATLDDVVPDTIDLGCQQTKTVLPAGWTLARQGTNTMLAIMSYRWGTNCLVLSDGTSWYTDLGTTCGIGQLTGTATTGYAALNCDRRVLITQPGVSMRFLLREGFCWAKRPMSAGGDRDITLAGPITNFIVLNRKAYAVIDNTSPTDTNVGCQTEVLRFLPFKDLFHPPPRVPDHCLVLLVQFSRYVCFEVNLAQTCSYLMLTSFCLCPDEEDSDRLDCGCR